MYGRSDRRLLVSAVGLGAYNRRVGKSNTPLFSS